MKRSTDAYNFLHSKLLFGLLFFIFIYLSYGVLSNVFSLYKFQKESYALETSINSFEEDKKSLEEMLSLLGTDDVVEDIARTKFGWTKDGEVAIVFLTDDTKRPSLVSENNDSNIQKWYSYFFTSDK